MHMASSHHLNVGYELRNLPGFAEGKFSGAVPCLHSQQGQTLTDDPEDAQDVGGKDDQQVDTSEQANSNEHMPQPAELAVLKQHLLEGAAHLGSRVGRVINLSAPSVPPRQWPGHLATCTLAHRKQNNWHCECDCRQHGHTHTQDQHIKRVHLVVGVQQLRLHPVCGRQGGWSAGGPGRGLGSEPGLTLTLRSGNTPPQLQGTVRHHRPNERL